MDKIKNIDKTKDEYYCELCNKINYEYSAGGVYRLTNILLEHYNYLKVITDSAIDYKVNNRICKVNSEVSKFDLADILNVYEYEEVDDKKFVKDYFNSDKIEQTIFLKEKIDKAIGSVKNSSKFMKDQTIYRLRYYIAKNYLIANNKEPMYEIADKHHVPVKKALREKENTIIQIALFLFPPFSNRIIKNLADITPDVIELYMTL